jgi:catechol 2,3-dioxygenase
VRLQVADMPRSLDYYRNVLGLHPLAGSGGSAMLGAADGRPLVQLVEKHGIQPVPKRGLLGLYHFAILLPDRAALGRFVSHLAEIGVHAGSADHAVSEAVYLTDPDGLGIEVYADRPRTSWRSDATRELFMTTAPLDVRGVMSAAGGATWSGMPAGTAMGHVHLHVGSLDEAEAFYHRALGFDKIVWTYPGALFLSAGGYHHHLGTNTWSAGPPADDGHARLLSWEIVTPHNADVLAAARSLGAAGFLVDEDQGQRAVSDPWGTRLRVVSQE